VTRFINKHSFDVGLVLDESTMTKCFHRNSCQEPVQPATKCTVRESTVTDLDSHKKEVLDRHRDPCWTVHRDSKPKYEFHDMYVYWSGLERVQVPASRYVSQCVWCFHDVFHDMFGVSCHDVFQFTAVHSMAPLFQGFFITHDFPAFVTGPVSNRPFQLICLVWRLFSEQT
jgi:hypothetical protein